MSPSLFILSLPRSLSSEVHRLCCDGLQLRNPSWTSSGEILNPDRSIVSKGQGEGAVRYFSRDLRPEVGQVEDFLAQVFQPFGHCYKDVVQPFVVSRWLRRRPDIKVLKITPNITHVAFAMLQRGWTYPCFANAGGASTEEQMMSSLLAAADAIADVPGEVVGYDDLVHGASPLRAALNRLYPERDLQPMALEPDFATKAARVMARRETAEFQRLKLLENARRRAPPHAGGFPVSRRSA